MKTKIWSIFGLAAFVIAPLFAWAGTLDTTQFDKYAEFTASGNASGGTAIENLPVPVRFSAANIGGLDYNDIGLTDSIRRRRNSCWPKLVSATAAPRPIPPM